eukprot:CAMPEP_0194292622 /NCGR_PEP_ID=MMETSP0169-20130528/46076_1 /TAXON_ID=218684 /ORGANISM="Corethron pennatum, Strain L29A3" /LENGTH=363 /DNA_ID=CAMNT_0039040857 /DNA_START=164 /DNA_END=1255 /DNA_ORIENTATION=+
MQIDCVTTLTPLDMMALSMGTYDATGHRSPWTGAHFFIEAFLRWPANIFSGHTGLDSTSLSSLHRRDRLHSLRQRIFSGNRRKRHLLELGCGTGASGIAVLLSEEATNIGRLTLTDNDASVLMLAQRNCELNGLQTNKNTGSLSDTNYPTNCAVHVCPLQWDTYLSSHNSSENVIDCFTTQFPSLHVSPDISSENQYLPTTILATDVIYDIGIIRPLMETAAVLLQTEKRKQTKRKKKRSESEVRTTGEDAEARDFFVLSHVPRASVDDYTFPIDDPNIDGTLVKVSELDKIILQEAKRVGFVSAFHNLEETDYSILLPENLLGVVKKKSPCNKTYVGSMDSAVKILDNFRDIGAAIFIFEMI